jgi:hypothetical protein
MIPKLIHIQNGQRNYIRFSGKPAMLIEVFEFAEESKLLSSVDKLAEDFFKIKFPLLKLFFKATDSYLLFVATHIDDDLSSLSNKDFFFNHEPKYIKTLEYAASWYLHQCLAKNL